MRHDFWFKEDIRRFVKVHLIIASGDTPGVCKVATPR